MNRATAKSPYSYVPDVVLDDDTMPSSFEEKMKLRRSVRATLRDINEEVPMDLLVYTAAEWLRLAKTDLHAMERLAERLLYRGSVSR
ncbi:MAG: hypothetical protein R6V29_02040 [Spirochaetia bacterium]